MNYEQEVREWVASHERDWVSEYLHENEDKLDEAQETAAEAADELFYGLVEAAVPYDDNGLSRDEVDEMVEDDVELGLLRDNLRMQYQQQFTQKELADHQAEMYQKTGDEKREEVMRQAPQVADAMNDLFAVYDELDTHIIEPLAETAREEGIDAATTEEAFYEAARNFLPTEQDYREWVENREEATVAAMRETGTILAQQLGADEDSMADAFEATTEKLREALAVHEPLREERIETLYGEA